MHTHLHGKMRVCCTDSILQQENGYLLACLYLLEVAWISAQGIRIATLTMDCEMLSSLPFLRTKPPSDALWYRAIQDFVLPSEYFPPVAGDCHLLNKGQVFQL